MSQGVSLRSGDGLARERKARLAASMGLRIMSEQAAQLAKQGSMIPHPYPERQLSKLHETPPPLGVPSDAKKFFLSVFLLSVFLFCFLDRELDLSRSITLYPHVWLYNAGWLRTPSERREGCVH